MHETSMSDEAVGNIYRYFSGNYHFFGSFSEWYGIEKSGMVTLVFGFPASSDDGSIGAEHGRDTVESAERAPPRSQLQKCE